MTHSAIKITEKNKVILQDAATSQGKTIELVANEAIENYYENLLNWQIAEIKKSQEECRKGNVVSQETIDATLKSFTEN
ncbi:MAG: hypothetical protein FWE18_02135 [Alphaproteobacteria bacterium]|nr:hypothetical protein [Alphaproteobacteria bacterium]